MKNVNTKLSLKLNKDIKIIFTFTIYNNIFKIKDEKGNMQAL